MELIQLKEDNEELISLRDVRKKYMSEKEEVSVLNGITVNISKGDFVMIMGKSGSGKTTLLNILGFLDTFDSGDYLFNGENVTKLTDDQRSIFRNRNAGFVFQQFNLLPVMTIYKNLELPLLYGKKFTKEERDAKIKASLEMVGLSDKINKKPLQLSGGQQQRITIARALINEPEIIFADEPTGALDRETAEDIMNVLKKLNDQGKTIIMVTHDEGLTEYATRVIRLKNGEVVESI